MKYLLGEMPINLMWHWSYAVEVNEKVSEDGSDCIL